MAGGATIVVASSAGGSTKSLAAGIVKLVVSDDSEEEGVDLSAVEVIAGSELELEEISVVWGTLEDDESSELALVDEDVSTDVDVASSTARTVELGSTVVEATPLTSRPMLSSPYPSNWRKTDADAMPESTETPRSTRGIIWAETWPLSEAEPPMERTKARINNGQIRHIIKKRNETYDFDHLPERLGRCLRPHLEDTPLTNQGIDSWQ